MLYNVLMVSDDARFTSFQARDGFEEARRRVLDHARWENYVRVFLHSKEHGLEEMGVGDLERADERGEAAS